MTPLLFSLSAADSLVGGLIDRFGIALGQFETRAFPDGETYLRLLTPVKGRDVVLLCTLDKPDRKTLPLLFAADAARAQGARSVGLAAPYLGYMRQDKAFHDGEAVTSKTYAALLSRAFDWLVTVDPHLHRHASLDAIYTVPCSAVSAAMPIADWIRHNVERPFLIGPDEESEQWVKRIGDMVGAQSTVLRKTRNGDCDVSIATAGLRLPPGAAPVVVDDIASSAQTLVETVKLVRSERTEVTCVVVHPIFAGDAFERLSAAGASRITSTNTIAHPSNAIDIGGELGLAIARAISG